MDNNKSNASISNMFAVILAVCLAALLIGVTIFALVWLFRQL